MICTFCGKEIKKDELWSRVGKTGFIHYDEKKPKGFSMIPIAQDENEELQKLIVENCVLDDFWEPLISRLKRGVSR